MLQNEEIIPLGADAIDHALYSTREMIANEQAVARSARELTNRAFIDLDPNVQRAAIRAAGHDEEQAIAARAIMAPQSISLFEGAAGSGKSRTLTAIARSYEQEGLKVLGSAAAWRPANQLGQDCNIPSRAFCQQGLNLVCAQFVDNIL